MTAMAVVERMTAEEFLARPYDPRERGWELIGGALVDMHDPLLRHQLACGEITYALEVWTRAQHGRGFVTQPIDVLISERSSPDAPQLDVALELTRDETLVSPLLDGFALKLDSVFGE